MCSLSLFSLYSEAATGDVHENIHMETPVLESLFNKAAGLPVCKFIKKETPIQVFSCDYCKVFKKTYFEEYLRTAASVYSKDLWNIRIVSEICFQRGFEFIKRHVIYKKNFISKEKSEAVKKSKLVTKIKKHFGTLVLASCC